MLIYAHFPLLYMSIARSTISSISSTIAQPKQSITPFMYPHAEQPLNMSNPSSSITLINGTTTSTPTLPTPCSLQAPTLATQIQWQKQLVLLVILVIIQMAVAFAVREIYNWHLRGSRRRRAYQQQEERDLNASGAANITGDSIELVDVVAGSVV